MSADPTPEYMRPSACAAVIGVSIDRVHTWIRAGELPASDLSNRNAKRRSYYVSRDDLDSFIASRAVIGTRTPTRSRRRSTTTNNRWF